MRPVTTHTLYLDDSGTKEYAASANGYSRSGNTRYFVFGGILLSNESAGAVSSRIIELKLGTFQSECVEIKSNWLRRANERRRYYLEPYSLTEETLDEFVARYYEIVSSCDGVLIAAVVDKEHMQEQYSAPWYPPAVAYEGVLQRAELSLGPAQEFSVIIDDMSGATPRGNQYKYNLGKQHLRLRKYGSSLLKGFRFDRLHSSLRFVNSEHSHLVQLADVVAYNVFRQFVEHGVEWEQLGLLKLPTYDHFAKIARKFRTDGNGRIQGFGVVKFPLQQRVLWRVPKR